MQERTSEKARKRLLFVVNNLGFLISHRLPVARAARDVGLDVHIAGPVDVKNRDTLENEGFHVHEIKLSRSRFSLWPELRSILEIGKLLRTLRPSVLHLVTIKPVLYGGLVGRILRVPNIICAVSGLGTIFIARGAKACLRRALVLLAYRLAIRHPRAKVIFQNEDDLGFFLENGAVESDQTILIRGSGVDLREYIPSPEPEGAPVVMLPARMLRDKGVGEFVEAARILKRQNTFARFVLVGGTDPGNPTGISEDQLRDWVAEGVVEWWGHRTDMPSVFQQATIVCLPSYREGLPKALIEAAGSARPIVTTDVPGCRDVVTHGENGFLVPARTAGALALAIAKLLQSREMRREMGKCGRARAERIFGVEWVISQTLALYGIHSDEPHVHVA